MAFIELHPKYLNGQSETGQHGNMLKGGDISTDSLLFY